MKKLLYYLYSFTKIENNQITIHYKTNSGSNTYSLFKLMPESIKKKYNVFLYKEKPFSLKKALKNKEYKSISEYTKKIKKINSSKLIFTTHGPLLNKRNITNFELWHGFPLKSMGLMDNHEMRKNKIKEIYNGVDYIASYSQMYNVLMSACTGIPSNKFIITGMPRNDFLFKSDGRKNLQKIFNIQNKKIIFFMPTFRKGYNGEEGNKNFNNIFGFKDFNEKEFIKFLELNNLLFIAKLHPNEENKIKIDINGENFKLLKDKDLERNNMDLYELINGVDLLITDYSSIYFDYLLLNRPIIFTPVDLEEYRKTRVSY
nr:CDP-glycerol glycerophosphotransferase family protein [Marinitoga lauensis]